jgi:hypothetical protein
MDKATDTGLPHLLAPPSNPAGSGPRLLKANVDAGVTRSYRTAEFRRCGTWLSARDNRCNVTFVA